MKEPRFVRSRFHGGRIFPIKSINYPARQVTINVAQNVYKTVSFDEIKFDMSNMTPREKETFQRALGALR